MFIGGNGDCRVPEKTSGGLLGCNWLAVGGWKDGREGLSGGAGPVPLAAGPGVGSALAAGAGEGSALGAGAEEANAGIEAGALGTECSGESVECVGIPRKLPGR